MVCDMRTFMIEKFRQVYDRTKIRKCQPANCCGSVNRRGIIYLFLQNIFFRQLPNQTIIEFDFAEAMAVSHASSNIVFRQ